MRALVASVGLVSAFIGLPWLTAFCIIALTIRYPAWEAIALGLLMDLLWLPGTISLEAFPFFTIGTIIIIWLFEPLRNQFLR